MGGAGEYEARCRRCFHPEPVDDRPASARLDLVAIDGSQGEGGGQVLRTALALSAVTGRGFRVDRIRAQRLRPGLRPQHLAAVRAAALACGAEVHGAFEGSPDLRFLPQAPAAGEFELRHRHGGRGDARPADGAADPGAGPGAEPRERASAARTCRAARASTSWRGTGRRSSSGSASRRARRSCSAGFAPEGEGRLDCEVRPWARPATLDLSRRGAARGRARRRGRRPAAGRRGAACRGRGAGAALGGSGGIETEWDVVELDAPLAGLLPAARGDLRAGPRGLPAARRARPARRADGRARRAPPAALPRRRGRRRRPLARRSARGAARARPGRRPSAHVGGHRPPRDRRRVLGVFGVPVRDVGRRAGREGCEVGRWP